MVSFIEGPDLIIVVVLVLVLFGGSQLPKFAKNLGKAQQEFKKGLADASHPDTPKADQDVDDGTSDPTVK